MPGDGAILDPHGNAEERRWRQNIESQLRALKQRPQTQALAFKSDNTPKTYTTAPDVFSELTNLQASFTVGSDRLIRVTVFVLTRIHILGGTVITQVLADDFATIDDAVVYGGHTVANAGDIDTSNFVGLWTPEAGQHTLHVVTASTTGEYESPPIFSAPVGINYLLVEDAGLAP